MKRDAQKLGKELADRKRFETLVSGLLPTLMNTADDQLDSEIEAGIQRIAEFLGLDQGILVQWGMEPAQPVPTHSWTAPGKRPVSVAPGSVVVPWVHQQSVAGKAVMFSKVDDLPEEAREDKAFFRRAGTRAMISLPLNADGKVTGVMVLANLHAESGWPEDTVRQLRLIADVFAGVLECRRGKVELKKRFLVEQTLQGVSRAMEKELEERLKFEALMTRLSLRFMNLTANEVDGAIEDSQRLFCESLDLDRSSLFQYFDEEPGALLLTHLYQREPHSATLKGLEKRAEPRLHSSLYWLRTESRPPAYARFDAKVYFPWVYQRLEGGETVVIASLDELPAEAATDREMFHRYGARSSVVVPLSTGGAWYGCLTFANLRERKNWSEQEVRRFQFVAHVFANALARKRGDEALRESSERLSLATESAGAGLWSMQIATNKVWMTSRMRDLLQLKPEQDLTFESFLQHIHAEDREGVRQATRQALQTGEDLSVEFRVVLPDGKLRWISARGRRHYDPAGRPERLMGASVDITHRTRAEEQLRESEERFRALVEQAGDAFELVGEGGRFLDVNAAALKQLGYTREEMLRLSVFDVDPSLRQEEFAKGMQSSLNQSPLRVETVHRRKDGSTFPVEVTITGVQLHGRQCALTLVRDITERKLAEEALTRSFAEIKRLKDRLQAESEYLKAEIKVNQAHSGIIGQSRAIKKVLHQVEQVAPTDSVVLVNGETGTGKELIAQEIHRLSRRRERLLVLVNCAALPSALVESELFGRERGAYTGALSSQVGRFEVADGSTIFLDEVGELSVEVQAKLLRVLQQGEFQRLGSPKTHKVDVRVIAATNRDLSVEVRKGRFREDLYYRLKVFPIEIPPLRERIEDIPLLVFAFMEEFSTRMGKRITKVARKTMDALQGHPWPGNIRELRNVIEHSVILTPGDTLKLSALGDAPVREAQPVTLAEAEREHILKTLESTGWRIKGPHGAAQRLDMQPSTLYSRMQKLGIPHRRQKDEMSSAD